MIHFHIRCLIAFRNYMQLLSFVNIANENLLSSNDHPVAKFRFDAAYNELPEVDMFTILAILMIWW